MLTEREAQCVRHFLAVVESEKQVIRIAASIFKGKLNPKSRSDAVDAIVMHMNSIDALFCPRVTEHMLRRYLCMNGVAFDINSSKVKLGMIVLQYWKLNDIKMILENGKQNRSSTEMCSLSQTHDIKMILENGEQNRSSTEMCSLPQTQQMDLQYLSPVSCQNQQTNHPASNASAMVQYVYHHKMIKEYTGLKFDEFVHEFAKSYYKLLNETTVPGSGLSTAYMFENCSMEICLVCNNEERKEFSTGFKDTVNLLIRLKQNFGLLFVPNLSETGVRGKMESHGLVLCIANGTLHLNNGNLAGIYEQSFVLSSDLGDNNFKILKSTLVLRSDVPYLNSSPMLMGPSSGALPAVSADMSGMMMIMDQDSSSDDQSSEVIITEM